MSAELKRDKSGRLVLVNGCCAHPHGFERAGKLVINSRHEKNHHPLEASPDELRRIADELEKATG